MASLSAQSIVPSRPWRMTRIQTRISHVHPTTSIHQRGTLLRACYFVVLRAGAPPAMLWRTRVRTRVLVTRSEATVERWMGAARTTRGSRRSGPAEERAQQAEGRSRRTGGGSEPTSSIRSTGGALTDRMTAETLARPPLPPFRGPIPTRRIRRDANRRDLAAIRFSLKKKV